MKINFSAIAFFAVAALLFRVPMEGQSFLPLTVSGGLTAAGSSCGATNCVQLNITSAVGTAAFQVSGTFVGTVQFEGSVDGTNWAAIVAIPMTSVGGARVTSATAVGTWQMNVAGYASVRVRCSAFTSGTINVTMRRAPVTPLSANS